MRADYRTPSMASVIKHPPPRLLLVITVIMALAVALIEGIALNTRQAHADSRQAFYAAPWGSPGGRGDWRSPWDLQTALNNAKTIRPGDTLYLRGGAYRNVNGYTVNLSGSEGSPVTIRSYGGEWAIIDRANTQEDKVIGVVTLPPGAQYLNLLNLEIMNSDARRSTSCPGPNPSCYNRPAGVKVMGPHNKLVNLVIHDNGNGVAMDNDQAADTLIYGCMIYNNGWWGPDNDRAHGHGVYAQNANDANPQQTVDNLIFNNFETGIKVYAEGGHMQGETITGNMLSANGTLPSPSGAAPDGRNLLMGSTVPANALRTLNVTNNYAYQLRFGQADNVDLGNSVANNINATFQNNVLLGGNTVLSAGAFSDALTVDHNKIIGLNSDNNRWLVSVYPKGVSISPQTLAWDYNDYYTTNTDTQYQEQFHYGNTHLSFPEWQQTSNRHYDEHGTFTTSLPAQNAAYVRPNTFAGNRAYVMTFNYTGAGTVAANFDGVIPDGYYYDVYNAYSPFCIFRPDCGSPVLLYGTYQKGQPVDIPVDNSVQTMDQPVGWTGATARNGQPYVGLFMVSYYRSHFVWSNRLTFTE